MDCHGTGLAPHSPPSPPPLPSPPRLRHARNHSKKLILRIGGVTVFGFVIQHQITDGRVVQAQVLIDAVRLAPGSAGLSGGFSAGQAGGFRFSVCRLAVLSRKRAGGVALNLSVGG